MQPTAELPGGALASASSHHPNHGLDVRFHDTLASGDRLWIRGRVRITSPDMNGHADKKNWWKVWRKNGEHAPPPLSLTTTIAGQQLQTELSVRADGHFEGLLTAGLPPARRGWRIARNRVALNGFAIEACNVVLVPPEPTTTVLVILPIEMTFTGNGMHMLEGTLDAHEIASKLKRLRRSTRHSLSVHYVAVVPVDSAMQRPDIAIAVTALGWPAGNLLLLPTEHAGAHNTLSTGIDRMRWLLGHGHDLWVLPTEAGLCIPTAAFEPQEDRATVLDLRGANGTERTATTYPRRSARPTRAALLPRHPIVFCHGMLGYSMLKLHRPTEINYFTALRGFLDPRGVHMLFPTVGPTSGVAERAEQLRDQIIRWTDEPVNVVAHSMGGLDARFMISRLGMADRVRSLTSIATPHRGSFMADWFQSNFRHRVPLLLALEAVGFNVNGFGDCRPAHCAKFNADTPDAANVRYFSHGGDVPPARLTPFLRRAWGLLTPVEGPNDGLVSVKSARWGEYLGNIQADHFAQTPDGIFVRDGEDFDALGFYVRLVEDLARRGF